MCVQEWGTTSGFGIWVVTHYLTLFYKCLLKWGHCVVQYHEGPTPAALSGTFQRSVLSRLKSGFPSVALSAAAAGKWWLWQARWGDKPDVVPGLPLLGTLQLSVKGQLQQLARARGQTVCFLSAHPVSLCAVSPAPQHSASLASIVRILSASWHHREFSTMVSSATCRGGQLWSQSEFTYTDILPGRMLGFSSSLGQMHRGK